MPSDTKSSLEQAQKCLILLLKRFAGGAHRQMKPPSDLLSNGQATIETRARQFRGLFACNHEYLHLTTTTAAESLGLQTS